MATRVVSPQAGLTAEVFVAHRIKLSDIRTGETLAELAAPDAVRIEHIFFSHDGQEVMNLNADRLIQVWDLPRLRSELAKLNLDWGGSSAPVPPRSSPGVKAQPTL